MISGTRLSWARLITEQGLTSEVDEAAITILSAEPPTAHYISTELAEYFCCDTPPPSLVNAMAATFTATDGDIASVLRTLFASPEFKASLGTKFKDPIHYAVSALRASLWPAGDPQSPSRW